MVRAFDKFIEKRILTKIMRLLRKNYILFYVFLKIYLGKEFIKINK